MSFIRLCLTRETLPQEIEHYLNAHHNVVQNWTWTSRGLHVDPAPEGLFQGSRLQPGTAPPVTPSFWLKHRKSPLLPIKRYRQFEDHHQKLRLHPCDFLIQNLRSSDRLHIQIAPLEVKFQNRLRKRLLSPRFELSKRWDRFESQFWVQRHWINWLGPLWRWTRMPFFKKASDPKQSERHDREAPIDAALDKVSRPLFRVYVSATRPFSTFSQSFTLPHLGELSWSHKKHSLILSSEELATLLGPPSPPFISQLEHESAAWLPGEARLLPQDRLKHLHIIGKTGMGKSTAILRLFQEDLRNFPQILLMDPHGDLIEQALELIPSGTNVIHLDPSDRDFPLALNPLELQNQESLEQRCSSLLEMFYALSKGSWGPRLEYVLRNALLTLLLYPQATLLDIPRLLTDLSFCQRLAKSSGDPELERFWNEEFIKIDARQRQEMIAPILNKVGPLLSMPLLRNIFSQPKSKVSFDELLKEPAVILVPLSKSALGEDASRLLGMSLISLLHGSLLKRKERLPLALTLDEFQNFATPTLMTMLSESRKFGLALTLAHQYLKQVPEPIMDSVLGNVGSHMVLRCAYEDALRLAPLLQLEPEDLMNLPELNAYIKALDQGAVRPTVRMELEPIPRTYRKIALESRWGRPRSLVEAKLKARYTRLTLSTRP